MEIGFNAGHSAELFLSTNANADVVSFDIGVHSYVNAGKQFLDDVYPGRHTLVLGNSLMSVPHYSRRGETFDVIFIDGGHDYSIAKKDIENCMKLAHQNTIVIMDDTITSTPEWTRQWNHGPTRAWLEAQSEGIVVQTGSADFEAGRGQSWGRYVL